MFVGESVYVMGHSESAAHVAMIMLNFTDDVDLLLRGDEPTWSDETATLLEGHPSISSTRTLPVSETATTAGSRHWNSPTERCGSTEVASRCTAASTTTASQRRSVRI